MEAVTAAAVEETVVVAAVRHKGQNDARFLFTFLC